jgi:hypothetical protein
MRLWRCLLESAPIARTRRRPAQHRPLPPQSPRPPCQTVRRSPPRPDHPLTRLQLWAGRRCHRRVQELRSLTSSIPLCPDRSHDRLFTRSPYRSRPDDASDPRPASKPQPHQAAIERPCTRRQPRPGMLPLQHRQGLSIVDAMAYALDHELAIGPWNCLVAQARITSRSRC